MNKEVFENYRLAELYVQLEQKNILYFRYKHQRMMQVDAGEAFFIFCHAVQTATEMVDEVYSINLN